MFSFFVFFGPFFSRYNAKWSEIELSEAFAVESNRSYFGNCLSDVFHCWRRLGHAAPTNFSRAFPAFISVLWVIVLFKDSSFFFALATCWCYYADCFFEIGSAVHLFCRAALNFQTGSCAPNDFVSNLISQILPENMNHLTPFPRGSVIFFYDYHRWSVYILPKLKRRKQ